MKTIGRQVACHASVLTSAMLCAFVGATAWAADASPHETAAPPPPAARAQIDKLVGQLGDKDYFVRQQAQEALARLGFEASDALTAAADNDDLEIASRAKYLLRLMRVQWMEDSDPPEVKKYLRDYESLNREARQSRMSGLGGLPDGQGLAALCRLVRYEKSLLLSKYAAVQALQIWTADRPPKPAVVKAAVKILDASQRVSAGWLLTCARLAHDPETLQKEWSRLVEAERAAAQRNPSDSRPEIVAAMLRFQIAQWKKSGRVHEVLDALERLVELERGSNRALVEYGDWLIEHKDWAAIEQLAKRFQTRFAAEPILMYLLARAHAEQGQQERAEAVAAKALALYPGPQAEAINHHLEAAMRLRQCGLFTWARREFEHIIATGDPDSPRVLNGMVVLAEMLHDQGKDLDAAQTLEKMIKSLATPRNARPGPAVEMPGIVPKALRARMHYFFASHWQQVGDLVKRRAALAEALAVCDDDTEVLIACYRLPDQTPQYHARIVALIRQAVIDIREQIDDDPENDTPYNELAWLVGNTEGDLDEALRCSQKSLELKPNTGGYYDTLGRVSFARGELENAVKFQTRAAELDPHSGQIRRQLEQFRKALADKGKKP